MTLDDLPAEAFGLPHADVVLLVARVRRVVVAIHRLREAVRILTVQADRRARAGSAGAFHFAARNAGPVGRRIEPREIAEPGVRVLERRMRHAVDPLAIDEPLPAPHAVMQE